MGRSKKPATAVCVTCLKSDITSTQIALYKMNDEHFNYNCGVKNTPFSTHHARFNRKNCGLYKGPGSGKT